MSEKALWSNVIMQALVDATVDLSGINNADSIRIARHAKRDARAWFHAGNRDFVKVCNLADLDPIAVVEHAKRVLERADDAHAAGEPFQLIPEARKPIIVSRLNPTYTHDGKTLTLGEWASIIGVSAKTLAKRLDAGYTNAEAFRLDFKPRRANTFNRGGKRGLAPKLHTFNGETRTFQQWADFLGITTSALHARMKRGRTLETALAMGGYQSKRPRA